MLMQSQIRSKQQISSDLWAFREGPAALEPAQDGLKHWEDGFREGEEKHHSAVRNVPGMVYHAGPDRTPTTVSEMAEKITGHSAASFTSGRVSWLDVIHPDDRERVLREAEALDEEPCSIRQEYRIVRKDGSIAWVEDAKSSHHRDGQLDALDGMVIDITERRRSEATLRDSEEMYRTLVNALPDGITRADLQGRITFASPRTLELLGYETPAELVGRHAVELIVPEEKQRAAAYLGRTSAEDTARPIELTVLRKDGTRLAVEVSANLIRDGDGRPSSVLAIIRDVSARVQLETELRHAIKMESIGRLAGGIVHNFNNYLTAMLGFGELLLLDMPIGDTRRQDVERIVDAARSAAQLTSRLGIFSRKQIAEPRVVDLNELVRDTEKLLRHVIGEDISVRVKLAPDLWKVKVDPNLMEQVIMNLAVNARDAMRNGGTLTIETANYESGDWAVDRHVSRVPDDAVMLAITDTGSGMSEEVQSHLFEPFFTTKREGEGTGLGLSTVYGIVKQAGGDIWCHSEEGVGTTFQIYLPRASEQTEEAQPAHEVTALPTGSETILLAEDDSMARGIASVVLRRAGYKVLLASEASEALDHALGHDGPIHLLLTDVVMPQMSGPELARRFGRIHPEAKVLLTSGYASDTTTEHTVPQPGIPYIQKPFTALALASKVRQVLET